MNRVKNWGQFTNERILDFFKKTNLQKAQNLITKMENVSKGVFNHDTFTEFELAATEIYYLIREDLYGPNSPNWKDVPLSEYADILVKVQTMIQTMIQKTKGVIDVKETSVPQLNYVHRQVSIILESIREYLE